MSKTSRSQKKMKNLSNLSQILPHDVFISPQETSDQILIGQIMKLHQKERMKIASSALLNMYGRHNPVDYKKQYKFSEKWQEQANSLEDENFSVLKHENMLTNILFLVIVVLSGLMVWFLSIFRLFKMEVELISSLSILAIITQTLDMVMSYFLFFKKKKNKENEKIIDKVNSIISTGIINIMLIAYLFIITTANAFVGQLDHTYFALDLIFMLVAYKRFANLYAIVKIKILASQYRNQLQVLELFIGCLMRVHIFSVVLLLGSITDPSNNWTNSLQLFNVDWLSRYIYSMYFACTTMFTVGYGDVTPKNKLQIVTIIFTQVFGVINIGYIISQIGRFLSKINQNQQIFYKNISQAERLAHSLKLNNDLTSKVRNVVIQNSLNNHQVNLEEENQFLYQLTDEIRQDIKFYSQFNEVKRSIFFICNWSKFLQKKIANCLIKSIYMPQQTLLQVPGKQKIYIIANGFIDIHLSSVNSKDSRRPIHVIGFNPKQEVQSNVYGYSSVISELKIKLKGIAKEYVTCYSISKEDMLRIVMENQADFEYYHEIKSRIILSKIKEKWQAPSIFSIRECYNPMPYVIIKKHKVNYKESQLRRYQKRNKKRNNLIIFKQSKGIQSENEEYHFSSDNEEISKDSPSKLISKSNSVLTEHERIAKYKDSMRNKQCLVVPRTYQRKNYKKKANTLIITKDDSKKQSVLLCFQGYQNYQNYLSKHNISNVLLKFYLFLKKQFGNRSELSPKMKNKRIDGFENEQIFEKLIKAKQFKSFKQRCSGQ